MTGAVSNKLTRSKVAEATRCGRRFPGRILWYLQASSPPEYARVIVGIRVRRSGPPNVFTPARCSGGGAESSIPQVWMFC